MNTFEVRSMKPPAIFYMKNKIAPTITIAMIALSGISHAQTTEKINSQLLSKFSIEHQKCLDQSANMWNCSNIFYKQMDSLLNVVYKNIKRKLTPGDFRPLKEDELKWIAKRDKVYSKANKESKEEGLGATDASMVGFQEEANFTEERILFLLNKYR